MIRGRAVPRVLFVAEAVSLAHVARPVALARSLGPEWDIRFASADQFGICLQGVDFPHHDIASISPAVFMGRLAKGSPLYRRGELEAYVEDDLRLLRDVKPDIVVGDFRLSLGVSARVAQIPYLAICNAYWSPWSTIDPIPLPDITLARVLGPALASPLFRLAHRFAFRLHASPLNALRRAHGLAPLPDVRYAYTDADWTLYADTPVLVPTRNLPRAHRYIGPILWSPDVPLPEWWEQLPARPLAYVTLGSSGRAALLPTVLDALEKAGFATVVATAGRSEVASIPGRRYVCAYLPGEAACARADLVVCNGGSPTAYQGLSLGKPILGLCSNLDQFLSMGCVERAGAGLALRASTADADVIGERVRRLRDDPAYAGAARKVREEFDSYPAGLLFADLAAHALTAGINE